MEELETNSTARGSSLVSTTPADSIATSVPAPDRHIYVRATQRGRVVDASPTMATP